MPIEAINPQQIAADEFFSTAKGANPPVVQKYHGEFRLVGLADELKQLSKSILLKEKEPICHSGNGKNWALIPPDDSSWPAHFENKGKGGHKHDYFAEDSNGDGKITKADCGEEEEEPTNTPRPPTNTPESTETKRPPTQTNTPESFTATATEWIKYTATATRRLTTQEATSTTTKEDLPTASETPTPEVPCPPCPTCGAQESCGCGPIQTIAAALSTKVGAEETMAAAQSTQADIESTRFAVEQTPQNNCVIYQAPDPNQREQTNRDALAAIALGVGGAGILGGAHLYNKRRFAREARVARDINTKAH